MEKSDLSLQDQAVCLLMERFLCYVGELLPQVQISSVVLALQIAICRLACVCAIQSSELMSRMLTVYEHVKQEMEKDGTWGSASTMQDVKN